MVRGVRTGWMILLLAAACGQAQREGGEGAQATGDALLEEVVGRLPNGFPIPDPAGTAASHGAGGFVDLDDAFHAPLGSNGRHCATCHAVESGWSIVPAQVELLFGLTGGTHPLFNRLDAANPDADLSTVEARRAGYAMLRRGLFRRTVAAPAGAEFEVVAAHDPHGFGTAAKPSFFRRPLTTANLRLTTGTMWDDRLSVPAPGGGNDLRAGLLAQARVAILGAEQGTPPSPELLDAVVGAELAITHAQLARRGVRLDTCGAGGGPAQLASQPLVSGRFDLYDAWIGLRPGACSTRRADEERVRIARGQELFNERRNARGGTCQGCHDAANGGTNVAGRLFDVKASSPAFATPDLPVYTLRNLATGELRETTDPGKGFVTGRWADVDRFKVPTLRGIAARAPYFHNGIAASLRDVVRHYEAALGFQFTAAEEEDLVAFLEAL